MSSEKAEQARSRMMGALVSAEEYIRSVMELKDLKVTPYGVRLDINMYIIMEDGFSLTDYADALGEIIGNKK